MRYLFEEMARDRAENPLYGEHVALYRRYTDQQCKELNPKNALGDLLGHHWAWITESGEKFVLACAGILRGLGAAQLRTGNASHFSLNRERYLPLDNPHHSGDPRDTYARTRYPMERLAERGFIVLIKGKKELSKESIAWLTDKGWEWVNRLSDPTALGEMKPRRPVPIVLRDKKKRPIDFPWTDEARRMEVNLAIINAARKTARIFRADGSLLPYEPYVRIFNIKPDLTHGGRFYLPGDDNHQNMPHDDRRGLMWEIDGVLLPTDEIDGCCMHAVLAYREMGLGNAVRDADAPGGRTLDCGDGLLRRALEMGLRVVRPRVVAVGPVFHKARCAAGRPDLRVPDLRRSGAELAAPAGSHEGKRSGEQTTTQTH